MLLADGISQQRFDAIEVNDLMRSIYAAQNHGYRARDRPSRFEVHEVVKLSSGNDVTVVATPPELFVKADGTRIRAAEIGVGDRLLAVDGDTAEVAGVQRVKGRVRVYTLALDGADCFYAGGVTALGGVAKDF